MNPRSEYTNCSIDICVSNCRECEMLVSQGFPAIKLLILLRWSKRHDAIRYYDMSLWLGASVFVSGPYYSN
jgi:hypothetical protein